MTAAFTPEQEARIREIVREETKARDAHAAQVFAAATRFPPLDEEASSPDRRGD